MFTRQGRRTDPHGHSHSVELHEAASPYRHPRYDGPSAKEKLIPLGPSAASGRITPDGAIDPSETSEPLQSGRPQLKERTSRASCDRSISRTMTTLGLTFAWPDEPDFCRAWAAAIAV